MTFEIHSKKYGVHIIEIDDEDAEKVLKHNWSLKRSSRPGRSDYFSAWMSVQKNKKRTWTSLHKFLMPNVVEIDHIDGNPLNNKKNNLRACLHCENTRNAQRRCDNKTGFKGVTLRENGTFRAKIRVAGKLKNIGHYATAVAAALAYNEAAREHFGEFARLNEIDEIAL